MKKSVIVARLLALSFVTAVSAVAFAAEGDLYQLVDDTSLRQGPGSSYAAGATAHKGDEVIELNRSSSWLRVRLQDGTTGWLYNTTLISHPPVKTVETGQLPVAKPSKTTAQHEVFAMNEVQSLADERSITESAPVKPTDHHAALKLGEVTEAFVLNGYGTVTEVEAKTVVLPEKRTPQNSAVKVEESVVLQHSPGKTTASDFGIPSAAPVEMKQVGDVAVADLLKAEAAPAPVLTKQAVAAVKAEGVQVEAAPLLGMGEPEVAVTPVVIQQGETKQIVQTTTIRSGPGALFEVLGWVGTGADILALEQQGQWLKVQMKQSGRTGWIEAKALSQGPAADQSVYDEQEATDVPTAITAEAVTPSPLTPVVEPQPLAEAKVDGQPDVLATEQDKGRALYRFEMNANLRAGPDDGFDVVSWASAGAYAVELAQQGDWHRVQMQESKLIGWVYKSSLAAVKLAKLLPETVAASAVVLPQAEPEMIQAGDVAGDVAGAVDTVQPESMPAMVIPADGKPMVVDMVADVSLYQFRNNAKLRAGPDKKFDVVAWAGVDAYARELSRQGDWRRVQMQESKRIGWTYKDSLAAVKVAQAVPDTLAVPAAASETETQAEVVAKMSEPQVFSVDAEQPETVVVTVPAKVSGPLYIFKQTSNLKAGPGDQFDAVAWGARNETATEIDRQGSWSRVRMTLSNKVGWVSGERLMAAETAARHAPAAAPDHVQDTEPGVGVYEVVRSSGVRLDSSSSAEVNGWVGKEEVVVVLERSHDWAKINPQSAGRHTGWIHASALKEISSTVLSVQPGDHVISTHNLHRYKDRVSHSERFNFSYAALEQAHYRVPVEELYITIEPDDMEALFRKDIYDKSAFDMQMKTSGLILNRALLGTVSVMGSSTRVFNKKSLMIKLDKDAGRSYGRRRIVLRTLDNDIAMMREWMSWKMMAALGMKVPEVHFVRVNFNNGERIGFYLSVEWMGSEFLAANDLDVKGEFYQPNDASHCGDLHSSEGLNLCFDKITPQDADFSNLENMARAVKSASVDEMHKVLGRYFNDESVINWIAVNGLVSNGDTYNKNYWLHRDPRAGKWTVIPWDYNLTFGTTYDSFGVSPYKVFNDNFQYWYAPDVGASNPLKDKALINPQLRNRLEKRIRHLLGLEPNGTESTYGWFSPTVMHARIGNLAAVVGQELYKDNFLTYGENDFKKIYETLMHYVTAHADFLNVKMFGRIGWEPVDPTAPIEFDQPLPKHLQGDGEIRSGGDSLRMVDLDWGLQAGYLMLDKPATSTRKFKLEIDAGQRPKSLPVGQLSRRCIQRTWTLSSTGKDSVTADVILEYIQENSRRTEVPETLHENQLEVWMHNGGRWKPLKTEVNEYANTLIAKGVDIAGGNSSQRFVACSPF